jgi:GNAT superfamily N-acetyltransferase
MTVRAARPDDLPGMLDLLRVLGSFDPAFDLEHAAPVWGRLMASPVTTVVVADVAGTVASTCTLAIIPNLTHQGRSFAVIENVCTLASHRRTGLARRVLAFACDLAWASDCYKVSVSTGSKLEATLRFYEGSGFTRNSKTFFEIRRP